MAGRVREASAEPARRWGAMLARSVLRHRLAFGLAWCACTAALAFLAITRLQVRAGIEQMIDDGAQGVHQHRELSAPDEVAVLVQGRVFERGFLTRLAALERELLDLKHEPSSPAGDRPNLFERSLSLLSVPRLESSNDALSKRSLSALLPLGVEAVEAAARADPAIAGRFVDARGELALILLQRAPVDDAQTVAAQRAVDRLVKRYDRDGFRVSIAGLSALKALIAAILYDDVGKLFVLAIGAAMLVLYATFRSSLALAGPGLIIGASSAWAFGAMAWCGAPLTIVGLYLPAFLTVVAIGDAIHVQSAYCTLRASARSNDEAIVEGCAVSAAPLLYTTLTTCVGLLGLGVAQIGAIRELGVFGAFGLASAWLHTVIVLPIVLSLLPGQAFTDHTAQTGAWLQRALGRISRLSHPRHGGTGRWIGLAVALALASALGMSKLRVHHEMIGWLPRDNALAPAVALLDDRLAGSATMSVFAGFQEPRAVFQHETLARLARAERRALAYRDPQIGPRPVRDVSGVLSVVRDVWRGLREPDEGALDLPPDAAHTGAVFQMLELLGAEELGRYVSDDGRRTRVDLRLPWTDASSYARTLDYVQRVFEAELGSAAQISITGPVANMNRTVDSVLRDLIASFAASCAGIVLTLLIFLRDLRLSLLAMVPNLLPIVIVLGAMGFVGSPVDVHILLLSSVLEGVIVDDTIHFLHHFRDKFRSTGDIEQSLEHTFEHSGGALLVTNVTLALGFLVDLASSMRHLQRMALLLGFSIMLALLVELILAPALLRRFGPTLLGKRARPAPDTLAADAP